MDGYWGRVDVGDDTIDDERLYNLLIPASFITSKIGHVAIYMYGSKKIFEIAVRAGGGRSATRAWAQFNSDALSNEIENLAKLIAENIRGADNK